MRAPLLNKEAAYEEKKERLAEDLKQRFARNPHPVSLYKNTSNLFRSVKRLNNDRHLDVRSFNKVLSVDHEKLTATVEGMTTYEELVRETLQHGCLPAVVPELKSITIGGALSGGGIESSSFRYGLVHETILEAEVLLGDGSVLTCHPENEFRDLFYALPNTFGTLGYALKVKVQLVQAKKFVRLNHYRFDNSASFFEQMKQLCSANRTAGPIDFIEGVIFDQAEMVITTGQFVDQSPYVSDYSYMNVYYQSIRNKSEDYLSVLDYIWRWDPDWFWCSKVFLMQNPLLRLLLGKWMLKSTAYTKIMRFADRHPIIRSTLEYFYGRTEPVIQDILIPCENALAFYEFFEKEIGIRPIWICPARTKDREQKFDFCPLKPESLYLDFGFWDSVKSDRENGYYNRMLERSAQDLNGFKSLYSTSYYSQEEFWTIYNHSLYQKLKSKYDPHSLLGDLYRKCVKN